LEKAIQYQLGGFALDRAIERWPHRWRLGEGQAGQTHRYHYTGRERAKTLAIGHGELHRTVSIGDRDRKLFGTQPRSGPQADGKHGVQSRGRQICACNEGAFRDPCSERKCANREPFRTVSRPSSHLPTQQKWLMGHGDTVPLGSTQSFPLPHWPQSSSNRSVHGLIVAPRPIPLTTSDAM
jgi:hypothetical protein